MKGEVGHFELPADKPERARKFYAAVFGWKMSEVPEMNYTMVRTGLVDDKGMPKAPGYIGGGVVPRGGAVEHPVLTIVVDEISEAEKAIEGGGGQIIQRKQAVGDGSMGYMGYFRDTEGNVVGLYQNPKQ